MEDDEIQEEDLFSKYVVRVYHDLPRFIRVYHIQIWIAIAIFAAIYIYYKNNPPKSKPFKKEIIEKNDENTRAARARAQENYRENLKTAQIPKDSPSLDNHDHTKKVGKKPTTTTTTTIKGKFTEGLNPSGSGAKLSFTKKDRSNVRSC